MTQISPSLYPAAEAADHAAINDNPLAEMARRHAKANARKARRRAMVRAAKGAVRTAVVATIIFGTILGAVWLAAQVMP